MKHKRQAFELQGPFSLIGFSFLTTSVMMLGELNFTELFFAPVEERMLPYPEVTVTLFVAFIVVMAIILINMMIGLAVDDIKAIQEQAVFKRLAMQVRD